MASRCFGKLVAEVLTDARLETVSFVPNTYHHPQRDIDTVVHGDDFVAVAEDGHRFSRTQWKSSEPGRSGSVAQEQEKCSSCRQLEWRRLHLGGGSEVDGEVAQHVDRTWEKERERRHPGGKDSGRADRDVDCELEYSDAKPVQAAAKLKQHIALDRPDVAYSVKTALQQMSKPTREGNLPSFAQLPFHHSKQFSSALILESGVSRVPEVHSSKMSWWKMARASAPPWEPTPSCRIATARAVISPSLNADNRLETNVRRTSPIWIGRTFWVSTFGRA